MLMQVKSKLKGHTKRISGLAFSNALNVLVSSGADAQVIYNHLKILGCSIYRYASGLLMDGRNGNQNPYKAKLEGPHQPWETHGCSFTMIKYDCW